MSNLPPPTLAEALRFLPVPALSADFDAQVLAALKAPVPLWHRLWQTTQPLLLGASGSLAVTLLLLHFALSAPATAPAPLSVSVQTFAAASLPPSSALPSVDALLDKPGLCAGSLTAAWTSPIALEPAPREPTPREPAPRRRAEVRQRVTLIA